MIFKLSAFSALSALAGAACAAALIVPADAFAAGRDARSRLNSPFTCSKPDAPEIAEGATASVEEMKGMEASMLSYRQQFGRYLGCLSHLRMQSNSIDPTDFMRRVYDDARREEHRVVARYRAQKEVFASRD